VEKWSRVRKILERGEMERGVVEPADTEGLAPQEHLLRKADGAPLKAGANLNKKIKQEVPAAAKRYQRELPAEINADREAQGKKPFDDDDDPPAPTKRRRDNTSKKKLARRKKAGFKTATKSTTGPDCGIWMKGKHQRRSLFIRQSTLSAIRNGYVPEAVVAPAMSMTARLSMIFTIK
jgi:hypothetical protein